MHSGALGRDRLFGNGRRGQKLLIPLQIDAGVIESRLRLGQRRLRREHRRLILTGINAIEGFPFPHELTAGAEFLHDRPRDPGQYPDFIKALHLSGVLRRQRRILLENCHCFDGYPAGGAISTAAAAAQQRSHRHETCQSEPHPLSLRSEKQNKIPP